ncbi:helix-turn-helix transcriptional regulator [Flavobacterium terrisoli]|uniref:helix-turn-helix transcriptional regulator n=1 Tax=Flavobacterium terrisoli TaxID=3242195 RepID=UPI0025438C2D|nr:WYL domain-containing protein [Flavobacterium buctense]
MARNQLAIPRYRVILRKLARSGRHKAKDIHLACVNSGIETKLRTIQNDLNQLRDDDTIFGRNLNIEYDEKTREWFSNGIPKEIFALLELEEGEITALLFYAKTISQYSGYPIFSEMTKAIKKVIDSSNISNNLKELFERETFLETEKHLPLKGIELIPDILHAIHNCNLLMIEYQRFDGDEIKTHEFKPILLKEDKQMWYIVGMNVKYEKIMTLALDRIKSLNITKENFEAINFNSVEYFKYSFGITVPEEEPIDVIISFTPSQGNYIRTLPIHSTQEILIDNTKEFKIQIRVIPSYEFYSKIRSYGEQAKIISPPTVVNEIKASLFSAASQY